MLIASSLPRRHVAVRRRLQLQPAVIMPISPARSPPARPPRTGLRPHGHRVSAYSPGRHKSHYADVRIVRQPLRAQSAGGAALAAGPPPVPAALHPALLLLDQPGRAVAGRTAAALPRTRGVLLARRAHHRARRLDQALERTRPALQMDQDRRPDHRPDLPLLLTHLRTGT